MTTESEISDVMTDTVNEQATRSSGGSPLLRFGPHLAMVLLALLVVVAASFSVTNYDTFFHLRLGQEFSNGWSLTHPGHFNQFGSRHWVPTQWLSEMWMYRFERWFGLGGVAWLAGLWYLGLAATLLISCRRQAPPIVASSVAAFAFLACHYGISPRPQVLSYILVAVVVDAWLRTEADGKLRWWLVPLTWLWATLHGMWILGVVTSVVAAGTMSTDRSRSARARWTYLGIPLGMALGAALTPVGPRVYGAVVLVGSRSDLFTEWKPANYTDPFNAVLAVMLIASVGFAARSTDASSLRIVLTLLALGWALYSERTVPIAAVTLAPLLSRHLAVYTSPWTPMLRAEKIALGLTATLALVAMALTAPRAGEIHEPSWVRPALTSLPAGTPIIAEMSPSGYLAWQYQNVSPLITGYADMYTDQELKDNGKLMKLEPGWDAELRRLDVRWALLSPKSSVAYALTNFEHWRTVETSKYVVLLEAPTTATP